jgi:hypothetical protein
LGCPQRQCCRNLDRDGREEQHPLPHATKLPGAESELVREIWRIFEHELRFGG